MLALYSRNLRSVLKNIFRSHPVFVILMLCSVGVNFLLFGANVFTWHTLSVKRANVALLAYKLNNEQELLNLSNLLYSLTGLSIYSKDLTIKAQYDRAQQRFYFLLGNTYQNTPSLKESSEQFKQINNRIFRQLAEGDYSRALSTYRSVSYLDVYKNFQQEVRNATTYHKYLVEKEEYNVRVLGVVLRALMLVALIFFFTSWFLIICLYVRYAKKLLDKIDSAFICLTQDMRSPITSIMGSMESLHAQVEGPLNQQQKGALEAMLRIGSSALEFIDDLLDISHMQGASTHLATETLDIVLLVKSCADDVEDLAAEKLLEFVRSYEDTPIKIVTNASKVSYILDTFLMNAIKYTETGCIQIEIQKGDKFIDISVVDTGKGIDKERLKQIFRPYSKEGIDLSQRKEGIGLGLVLSKAYASILGGKISILTERHKGSKFTLSLPFESEGV